MAAKVGDFSLILKLLGGIIIGALLGLYIGENAEGSLKHVMDVVVSLRHIFGQIIFFLVPLVIVGFITPAIVRLGQNASKILLVAVAFGNITTALYGIIAQVVSAYVTDAVLYGLDTAKVAYIISNFDREISEAIVQRMDRGVTILRGAGAWSGEAKDVLMCAFKQKEIVSLKELIFDVDPNAFIIVCNAHEVTGNGFKTYQKNEI